MSGVSNAPSSPGSSAAQFKCCAPNTEFLAFTRWRLLRTIVPIKRLRVDQIGTALAWMPERTEISEYFGAQDGCKSARHADDFPAVSDLNFAQAIQGGPLGSRIAGVL